MRKISAMLFAVFLAVLVSGCISNEARPVDKAADASPYEGKKILVIDSYNSGAESSDLKMNGIENVLNNTGIELRTVHMDEKNNPEEGFQKQAALTVKSAIESFKPDVIISLDDPAFKYVIMPYYKDSNIPVVFGGVNWDASVYGIPYNNTAGMVEVSSMDQLVVHLSNYSRGERIGLLAGDTATDMKNAKYYKQIFNISFAKEYHISTFEEWKQSFLNLQDEADYIIIENNAGIKNWNDAEAETFVLENIRIPAGAVLEYLMPYSLIGMTKITEEQGEWPAKTALRILDGAKPSDIPMVTNQRGKLYANLKIADRLSVTINPYFMNNAVLIR